MVNTDKALAGMGTINAIRDAWCDKLPERGAQSHDWRDLNDAITNLGADEIGTHALTAMGCAILNRQFRSSGWLFSMSESGKVHADYHASDRMVEVFADTIGV